jgi:hypothetical protein
VFMDESAGAIRSSGRAAHSEEILPPSRQRSANGPDNPHIIEVQALTPQSPPRKFVVA